jgi:lysine 2,3-aminomutase
LLLSWQEELAQAVTTETELEKLIELTPSEREGIRAAGSGFPMRISRYYAGLMDPKDPSCPIRKQAIPGIEELRDPAGIPDPIGEEAGTVAPNLIRLYPDRVAWCVSGTCATNCRFCFRKRTVEEAGGDFSASPIRRALDYISATPEIRDVLITGGEPLLLSDQALDAILTDVREIPHVEIVRIGTRVPVTLPRRVTPELCGMLKSHHPLWINTHFNHPRELTPAALLACSLLADSGIPLGNQSVLLKGVNDGRHIMKKLVQGLVQARIRPYYLFQCHLTFGTAHFRTPIESGLSIISGLRGSTTGFAVPTYIVDTARGKIALNPDTLVSRDSDAVHLRAPDGTVWREPNPRG